MGCINSTLRRKSSDGYIKKPKCIICFEDVENFLWPCGHLCLCDVCAVELSAYRRGPRMIQLNIDMELENGLDCPVCRRKAIPTPFYVP